MIWIGSNAETLLRNAEHDIATLTLVFTFLVVFAATQGNIVCSHSAIGHLPDFYGP
jgi:hypothetical protein